MDNTNEVFEYIELDGFEVELSLSTPDPYEDFNADLSFQSAATLMTITLPMTGSDLEYLAVSIQDALQRYRAQLDAVDIEDELED